ncbi:hypothetical protein EN742_06460 [Mesorhizobium sp. M4A.F.Ca.ET.020.02.1.1]|uniref:hypothetical protein n=1 Tax=Mesorhizobium sp. M4A.F.Ca.ET.020.02.1.1 TaxID=2496652 RepID=UPI000FD4F8A8|nr:hypothetical protein [Mesorhizobium sp. M4A.F.Ca.ET.020.02.1.1]RVD42854.1 hypothetical protein EN742_06460 [Mesorhizobium sp. M4A.F.Ca.ET.020.02.1.1]
MSTPVIVQTFYISTGAKNAMHTLRLRRDCAGLNPAYMPDHYVRNLAVDVETAQNKALAYFEAWKERVGGNRDDFILSLELEPEYDITKRRGRLSARDTLSMELIERGVFPFGKHHDQPIESAPDGYVLFFADKLQTARDADEPVMTALATACMGVALEKGLIAKRDAARQERREADALSNHVGKVGERRAFTGEIVTKFFKGEDGFGFWINKVRVGNDLLTYIGNELGERGDVVSFKATIKKHDEYKGVKSTVVNRPKILEPAGAAA